MTREAVPLESAGRTFAFGGFDGVRVAREAAVVRPPTGEEARPPGGDELSWLAS